MKTRDLLTKLNKAVAAINEAEATVVPQQLPRMEMAKRTQLPGTPT